MARNKLSDLNNYLFAQLERLEVEDLTKEELELELKRTKAMTNVASQVINIAKTTIDGMRLIANSEISESELPNINDKQ